MKKMFLILGLLFLISPHTANAQSQRNPCAYGVGSNTSSALGNCLAIGYYLAGVTGVPMPVGGIANASAPTFTEGKPGYLSFDLSGNLRVGGTFTPSATPTPVSGAINVTPTDCSGTITSGGAAQNAFTANAALHGFTIANIDTSEVMWISFTTTAAASGTGSFPLAPATATSFAGLSSFTTPLGFGINTALSVIATTSTHKFSCTRW